MNFFYNNEFKSIDEFKIELYKYINYYNKELHTDRILVYYLSYI